MNRKKTSFVILAVVITVGFVGYYLYGNDLLSGNKEETFATQESERLFGGGDVDAGAETLFPMDMNEGTVQIAIHQMSHQKVKSDKKWGALQITDDRIWRLIEVIEFNRSEYKHAELYLRILHRWAEGDFSQADDDHNAIWELQGGTIGKATGLISAEEEEKYIKKHFE